MNELESLLQLNKMLLAESPQYLAQAAAFPPDAEAQWRLFRSLVNVRAPRPAGGDFLALQDSLLQKITACKGVTAFHSLTPMQKGLYLWRGDITTLQTDGIVNAANSGLTGCYHPCHQCIDNAIHTFSGVQLRLACASIIKAQGRPEPAGQAKITRAYNLPCRYVLHTVWPAVAGAPRRRTAIYWRPVTVPVLRWRKSTGCAPSHFAASLPENFIFPAGKQRKSQSKP